MAQAFRSRPRERASAPHRLPGRPAPVLHPHQFRRRHHAAAIVVVVVLAVIAFQLFPGREVTVIKDGSPYRVSTTFGSRTDALAAAAVHVQPGDRVISGSEGSYRSVAVQRARPVTIDVDGRTLEVRTQATTVSGVLAESGIVLQSGDRVLLDGHIAAPRASLASAAYVARSAQPVTHEVAAIAPQSVHLSVARARPVTVVIDTLEVELTTAATTVAGVLADLGMTVREGDLVRPALDVPATAGLTIRLAKARSVNLRLDGQEQVLYTQAQTVADVLTLLGVNPGPGEILTPPRETPITSGMSIVIGLRRLETEVVDEIIQSHTVYETDPSVPEGQVRVVPGIPGLRQTTYEVTYENGAEKARVRVGRSIVLREPVPTRHISGARVAGGGRPILDVPGYNGPYIGKVSVRATWYNASHGAWARDDPNYGRTATGLMLEYGICAVDPNVIALGTRFYVPGYGTCLAADTGGLVKGHVVDLGFPEEAGLNPWNTQTLDIYILD